MNPTATTHSPLPGLAGLVASYVRDAFAVFGHELSPDEIRWLYGLGTARLAAPPTP